MDGEESFLTLVHYSGKIQKSKRHSVKFTNREPLSIFIRSSRSDKDIQVLFHYRRSISEVRIPELFAKLKDGIDSSRELAPNPQSTMMGGALTSMSVVAPACLLVDPPCIAVGTASSSHRVPDFAVESGPDRVENAMREDDLDDEPVNIVGDSDDDTSRNPRISHGPSSFGTLQHLPHLSALNLEAIGQQPEVNATFRSQGLYDATALTEFQIDQYFQSKEEAVLSVKDYSIRRGVEYRVMKPDYLKYHGRCKEFGKWFTWMIRITL
ncbi:uncharacterized protein LOC107615088 [Arachis ipaensis]|uniref:uncharacterized protein LOC107615088 n=1 Tax=Arachis ipaensis TaxID=130454 RepID=UPI0007AF190F|nr:uncharacterized protein LOC107615088 [Arachis ipaensis]